MSGPIERALAHALRNRQSTDERASDGTTTPTPSPSTEPRTAQSNLSNRRKCHVNTLAQRYAATIWMVEEAARTGPRHIISNGVKQFPQFFAGNEKANLQKASRWWKIRHETLKLKKTKQRLTSLTSTTTDGIRRARFKCMPGRGRKRARWVSTLYKDLLLDFERLRAAGLKFSASVLRDHAVLLIKEAPNDSAYHSSVVHKGKPIADCISIRWVQHFMNCKRIVLRSQTGKLMVSPEKQEAIEKAVAFHLGELKRGFNEGSLSEDAVENADETHFVFNMDNGKTLGFVGDKHVKYADVVSGGDPITMMVRLSGGRDASIHPPMIIFKNDKRSYPIRGIDDNIPGACYRSSPKGWMDGKVWYQWLTERRAIPKLVNDKERVLYVDNCSSHSEGSNIQACLNNIKTSIRKLPANATHLVQPADSFVIQKIKAVWRRKWDEYKYECIKNGDWFDGTNGKGSGKLKNPGKSFFLQLAADSVTEVNQMRDKNGVSYARKAMIRTGMSLNLNGLWEESQLSGDLQMIIAKHRNHFDWETVDVLEAEVETETDSDEISNKV